MFSLLAHSGKVPGSRHHDLSCRIISAVSTLALFLRGYLLHLGCVAIVHAVTMLHSLALRLVGSLIAVTIYDCLGFARGTEMRI